MEEAGAGIPQYKRHHTGSPKRKTTQQDHDHNPPAALDQPAAAVGEGAGVAECEECGEEKNS